MKHYLLIIIIFISFNSNAQLLNFQAGEKIEASKINSNFELLNSRQVTLGEISSFSVNNISSPVDLNIIIGDGSLNAGAIQILNTGKYKLTISFQITASNAEIYRIGYQVNSTIVESPDYQVTTNGAGEFEHPSRTFLLDLNAGDLLKPVFYSTNARTWKNLQVLLEQYR